MQTLIRSEFHARTILAVEHNLANIRDYDRVVILDRGEIVEFGFTGELLREGSAFRALWEMGRSSE